MRSARTPTFLGTRLRARMRSKRRDAARPYALGRVRGKNGDSEKRRLALGHRQIAHDRLRCWPQQDDQAAKSELLNRSCLRSWTRAWGSDEPVMGAPAA
jgi:hypothetical protein